MQWLIMAIFIYIYIGVSCYVHVYNKAKLINSQQTFIYSSNNLYSDISP